MHAESKVTVERMGTVWIAAFEAHTGYPKNGAMITQRITASGNGESVMDAVIAVCKEARRRVADDDQMSPERREAFLGEIAKTEENAVGADAADAAARRG